MLGTVIHYRNVNKATEDTTRMAEIVSMVSPTDSWECLVQNSRTAVGTIPWLESATV